MRRNVLLVAGIMIAAGALGAADGGGDAILGLWATDPGAEGGQARVEIFKLDGKYHGKIVWLEEPLYPADDEGGMAGRAKVDRENPDPSLRERPILGLLMMQGFSYDGRIWKGGTIYDPEVGKTYKCKMRLTDDGVLKVRGYIGFSLLGRTTEWTRLEAPDEPDDDAAAAAGER